MIRSFRCKETEKIWNLMKSRKFPPDIQERAVNKLSLLDTADTFSGTRLEALHGNRKGQMSIRINAQWRICFIWDDGNAENVEIVDYH